MQIKWKKCLPYVLVFLVPWILVIIHSVVRDSWLSGGGSILAGDAANVYYQMCEQLWEKVHHEGTLSFTWNAGMGTDFLVGLFNYMLSPLTLLVLVFPKSMIGNVVQFGIVLKWSLAAAAMLYYVLHSKWNELNERKVLVSVALTMAYSLGNVMLSGLSHPTWLDIMVLFPILLLLEEKMLDGNGYKRFLFLLLFCFLSNFSAAIPMTIFLTVWYGMLYGLQEEKNRKNIVKYGCCVASAAVTALVVIVPCVTAAGANSQLAIGNLKEYVSVIKMSFVDFLQRFFVFDSLLFAQKSEPMLYCGAVTVSLAVMYLFIPAGRKEKLITVVLSMLLCAGLISGGVDIVWLAGIGDTGAGNGYAFLLTFLLVFMAMRVLIHLREIRIWQLVLAAIISVGGVVTGFLKAQVFLDFYVYFASVMLSILLLLLIFFFYRKSIQYKNILMVFVVLSLIELLANAFYQLKEYNMYPLETVHYHAQNEALKRAADLEKGQRAASAQVMPNFGMYLDEPLLSGELKSTDNRVQVLFEKLGMAVTDNCYYYFGGSPLLNMMFNVKYGYAESEQAYSDVHKIGENNGYTLYEMNQTSSLGYMAYPAVTQWKPVEGEPFLAQNDYVKCAADGEDIFEIITPDVTCSSVMGRDPEHENEEHVHSEDEDEEEHAAFHGGYHEADKKYHYSYSKMFDGDVVNMELVSDGITDYYVFVDSDTEAYFGINNGEDIIYLDEIGSHQKTFHIGVVEKGSRITITANAKTDADVVSTSDIRNISYQFAAFHEENYQEAYETLTQSLYEITDMTDNVVKGTITAEDSGIMVTGIPALSGFTVYVDGSKSKYEVIGGALIGVPVDKGAHKVEFVYATPHMTEGLFGTVIGLLLTAGCCIWDFKQKKTVDTTVPQ